MRQACLFPFDKLRNTSLSSGKYPHKKKTTTSKSQSVPKYMRYIGVVKLSTTCIEPKDPEFTQEIIEWSCVVVDTNNMQIINTFHEYIRPVVHSELTKLCTDLTTIQQETVDGASIFEEVWIQFFKWLKDFDYVPGGNFSLATDGPSDIVNHLSSDVARKNHKLPHYLFYRWVNVRTMFSVVYQYNNPDVDKMLTHLGLKFMGNKHNGLDIARNVAIILMEVLKKGGPKCYYLNQPLPLDHSVLLCSDITQSSPPSSITQRASTSSSSSTQLAQRAAHSDYFSQPSTPLPTTIPTTHLSQNPFCYFPSSDTISLSQTTQATPFHFSPPPPPSPQLPQRPLGDRFSPICNREQPVSPGHSPCIDRTDCYSVEDVGDEYSDIFWSSLSPAPTSPSPSDIPPQP